jgi:hypothetical protein
MVSGCRRPRLAQLLDEAEDEVLGLPAFFGGALAAELKWRRATCHSSCTSASALPTWGTTAAAFAKYRARSPAVHLFIGRIVAATQVNPYDVFGPPFIGFEECLFITYILWVFITLTDFGNHR